MEIIDHIRNLPALAPEEIHVWGVHVPDMLDRMDRLFHVLNEQEREKAGRFRRESDRYSSIAARGGLRILLGGYGKRPADEILFAYSENGKPHMENSSISFNVSHSGDWVVIAVGRDREIGVDIELIKPEMEVGSIAKRYYLPEEFAALETAENPQVMFFRQWVRKEAYVKASGSTLFSELSRMPVPMDDGAERDGWYFHHLEAGSRYAAAVATDKPIKAMPCYDFTKMAWDGVE